MGFEGFKPGHSDAAEPPDMDRLIDEIQDYLRDAGAADNEPDEPDVTVADEGGFMPGGDPHILARVGRLARYGSYAMQGLCIVTLLVVVTLTWSHWLNMALALSAVLGFGILSVLVLLGVEARIRLLCDIETHTRRIARNKARIAELLERIWMV